MEKTNEVFTNPAEIEAKKQIRRKQETNISLKDVPSMIIGPKRQEGETQEEYHDRREKEKKLLKVRLQYGVSRHTKGQSINPNRKIKKATRKIKTQKMR